MLQTATISSTNQNGPLRHINQVFSTFRAGLFKRLNDAEESSQRRSAALEAQVKDLETEIEGVEAEHKYAYLKAGEEDAVSPKLGFFKTHFRGACRDIARGTGTLSEADEVADDETLPGDWPPGLIEDTDVSSVQDHPAATSIFNEHVHAMDESYHDFKTGILRQLCAMQTMDREAMLQLQAQNEDLTCRLAVAEEDRTTRGKELEMQEMKTRSAMEEAEKWKTQEYTLQRFDLSDFPSYNGQLKGIVVGTAFEEIREGQHASVDVLSWLGGQQIAVGYILQMGCKIHAVSYHNILDANIRFNEPFSWILAAADEAAVLRFESLIRHGLLARGFKNTIKGKGNLTKFRDHFPGACRDIA
ncbi:hypothetical protein E8E12_000350 [Didymella heteroderae]|uniref:Uncharacterized protein n=1 Tax=Didymella heteroderae TaxID=1769908 RepID=A0A9P5C2Z8_9PLEO|nr:hypothetical protein E8E12_000350 [Didymella heteroderae]